MFGGSGERGRRARVWAKNFHEWIYVGSPLTPNVLNDGKAGFPYPAGFKIPTAN
jgi:hypothetical protein